MTDHKYTDEEVIRALECCAVDPNSGKFSDCKNCPLDNMRTAYCFEFEIQKLALGLINRQRAEIERLTIEYAGFRGAANSLKMHYANAKSEAVKEFAERVKARAYQSTDWSHGEHPMVVEVDDIDELVEEMTAEKSCPDCKHFVGCEMACGGAPCDEYTEGGTE